VTLVLALLATLWLAVGAVAALVLGAVIRNADREQATCRQQQIDNELKAMTA
jgi:hypothetical protein